VESPVDELPELVLSVPSGSSMKLLFGTMDVSEPESLHLVPKMTATYADAAVASKRLRKNPNKRASIARAFAEREKVYQAVPNSEIIEDIKFLAVPALTQQHKVKIEGTVGTGGIHADDNISSSSRERVKGLQERLGGTLLKTFQPFSRKAVTHSDAFEDKEESYYPDGEVNYGNTDVASCKIVLGSIDVVGSVSHPQEDPQTGYINEWKLAPLLTDETFVEEVSAAVSCMNGRGNMALTVANIACSRSGGRYV
jgi:hypothetical protein